MSTRSLNSFNNDSPFEEAELRLSSDRNPFHLPSRLFQWLYSFSLIIFMLVAFALIIVTPLDIIVQTWGSPSTGAKIVIVIGACAIFFLVSFLLYVSRLYHSRVVLNQIPSKSVYVPLEKHDLPSSVIRHIDERLRHNLSVTKVRAGPLHNKRETLNFPGMLPPEYIQQRNIAMGFPEKGTFLPPNCKYNDVIDIIGLTLRFDGPQVTNFDIPAHYTVRELIITITKMLVEDGEMDAALIPSAQIVVDLYDKFQFGPDLIAEEDLVTFLVEFEKLSLIFHANRIASRHMDPSEVSFHPQPEMRNSSVSTTGLVLKSTLAIRRDESTVSSRRSGYVTDSEDSV